MIKRVENLLVDADAEDVLLLVYVIQKIIKNEKI